jgi:MYXO-CTERM domain-containing protein
LPSVFNSQFGAGTCVGRGTVGSFSSNSVGAEWCYNTDGTCAPGCNLHVGLNGGSTQLSVVGPNLLRVTLSTTVSATVPLHAQAKALGVTLLSASCTINATAPDLGGSFDLSLGIRPDNGELDLHLAQVNSFQLNLQVSGCGVLSDIVNFIGNIVDDISGSFIGPFVLDLLTPAIDSLVQGILPSPLGIEGLMDVGSLLAGVSPGTTALMEGRIVPGGYVHADSASKGLSLGVITGLNSDSDITTRTGIRGDMIPFASEPNLCVPPMAPPKFGQAPYNLPAPPDNAARATFFLAPADALDGHPDPAGADIAMGLSETFLDLTGHNLVSSGAMCLGVGTTTIPQLTVGTIGLLVPSLGELTDDSGKNPLLLVTRPQKAIDFTIGENTATSPALTLGIQHMEVDFYAFIYERYVRAFTLDLTMNVGVNLTFEPGVNPGDPAQIRPQLVGISSHEVTVKVLNSEFVKESPDHLEMVLPSVFDLVTPLLGNLGTIAVPQFAGFNLSDLAIKHVITSQDDFLALTADLGASMLMRKKAETEPFMAEAVSAMDAHLAPVGPRVEQHLTLVDVSTPSAEAVRRSMTTGGSDMPTVTFDAPATDSHGRTLEYSYSLNGGLYRLYQQPVNGKLVVRDPAFAWQGKYTIAVKSRAVGDYQTTSEEQITKVIIDSVGPKIADDKLYWDDSTDSLRIPMYDLVSEHTLTYAYGKPGADEPTEWQHGGTAEISREDAVKLAVNDEIVLYSRDEKGNQTIALVSPFHGQSNGQGCACNTTGGPSSGGVAIALFVGAMLLGGRRRNVRALLRKAKKSRAVANVLAFVGMTALSAVMPACDCSSKPAAQACETTDDCVDACEANQVASCMDGVCQCSSDVLPGRIGEYSDVATGADGSIWVSGYSVFYGDLVVAKADVGRIPVTSWEWVDGVPDVAPTVIDSQIRGGIDAIGDDVGMYTSIAVDAAGQPMVTYFDREHGSLKFAHRAADGSWQKHVIEQGDGRTLGEFGGQVTGMYTSLTLRTDDGRPGVAYLAHVRDANGVRAEVRYAAAQTTNPQSASDWQLWIVDSAPLVEDANDVYPLPQGLGLFIDSARGPDQAPAVVYYDRANGNLKLSKFNTAAGQFGTATVLDGSTGDAGWSPSVVVDAMNKVHVAYVGADGDDLKYLVEGGQPEIVDNGYRIVGTTVDNLPKPEFHFVGDDASLQLVNGQAYITYQDATTQELLLTTRQSDGTWTRESVAGATQPWPGAYGFFAATSLMATDLVMSTWVIDQPASSVFDDNWVEVFRKQTVIQ